MNGFKLQRRMPAAFAAMFLTGMPLVAQTTFNPVLGLDYIYIDNVRYVGEEGDADSGIRLTVELPVVRQLRKGAVSFTYSPQIEQYDKFTELDNTGHRFTFDLGLQPTPLSSIGLVAGFSRTQEQGDPTDPDGEIFIGRRTDRERAFFGLSYRNRLGGRFLWGFASRWTDWRFDEIDDFGSAQAEPIGDRADLRVSLDLLRSLSRSTNLGLRLSRATFQLEGQADEDSTEAALFLEHVIDQRTNLSFGLGGFEVEDDTGTGGATGDTRTGVRGFVTLRKQFRKAHLDLVGERAPSSGGSLGGTSTDTVLGVSVGTAAARRWTFGFDARYGRRDPSDELVDTIDTVAVGLSIGVEIAPRVKLRLSPIYTRQMGNDMNVDSLVLRGGFGLTWAPLERTRLGGGGS